MMLRDTSVVEIAGGPAIGFCGWLFAANGCHVAVVRVDDVPPRPDIGPLRTFLDAGKTVVQAPDFSCAPVREALAGADIVIADPGWQWSSLEGLASGKSPLSGTVDAFSPKGPYAGWAANELILTSLGGAAQFTTTRNGTPIDGFGQRFQYLAGIYLYCALVSKVMSSNDSPSSRVQNLPDVRVSAFESVVSLLPYLTTQYEYNGSKATREQSGPRFLCPCVDGWVCIYAGLEWEPICALIGDATLARDERFVASGNRFDHSDELELLFIAWCAGRTVAVAEADGSRYNVAITAVQTPADVLSDPEIDLWVPVVLGTSTGRAPGLPYIVNGILGDERMGAGA
jgi:hypothetical protein